MGNKRNLKHIKQHPTQQDFISVNIQEKQSKYFKICFKYVTKDDDYNFNNNAFQQRDFKKIFERLQYICTVDLLELINSSKTNGGVEFLPKKQFNKKCIFNEYNKEVQHTEDEKFIVIRYNDAGRLLFKQCGIVGKDDILHLIAITHNHSFY